MNPEVREGLRLARQAWSLLTRAGVPVALWELCRMAHTDRVLLRRAITRLDRRDRPGEVDLEILERLRIVRDEVGHTLKKFRRLYLPAPSFPEEEERQEMLLGLIGSSPAAMQGVSRWIADLRGCKEEAAHKIRIFEEVVAQYRAALSSIPPETEEAEGKGSASPGPTKKGIRDTAATEFFEGRPAASPMPSKWIEPLSPPESGGTASTVEPATARGAADFFEGRPSAPPAAPLPELAAPTRIHGPPQSVAPEPQATSAPAPGAVLTALTASPGNGKVHLEWTASLGALTYTVKRSSPPGGPHTAIATASQPAYTDTGLVNGTPYGYKVSAVNAAGESPNSLEAIATPVAPPPAPGTPAASPGSRRITLEWIGAPGATQYRVLRSSLPGGPYSEIATLIDTAYTDRDLANGTTYYYVVRAANAGGNGPPSPEVAATPIAQPPPPGSLKATPGDSQVLLAWTASPGTVSYTVKRSAAPGEPFTAIATVADTSFMDSRTVSGTTYSYAVSAANASGESPDSAPVQATLVVPPDPPAGLTATPGNTRVTLTWSPSARATKYDVRRAKSPEGPFVSIAGPTNTAYLDLTVANDTPYFYVVAARNLAGESAPCAPVEALPVPPPPVPAQLTANPGNGQVALSWTPSAGAAAYQVRRCTEFAGTFVPIGEPSEPAFVDATAKNGIVYFYYVIARNGSGESRRSTRVRAKPVAPPPAPARLAALPGNAQVTLTWETAERATRYRLRRATERRGPYVQIASLPETSYTDASVANGTTYYYIVYAANVAGRSPHAGPAEAKPVAPPSPPTGLAASPGNGRIALSWTPAERAASYRVMRSETPGGPYILIAGPSDTTVVDAPLANGKTYFYVVTAVNAGGESPNSADLQAMPMAPPSAPAGLEAAPTSGRVTLTWTPTRDAKAYTVKRSSRPGGPYGPIAHPAEPTYIDTDVVNGTPYYYVVSAVNAGGESPDSILIPAVPGEEPPLPAQTPSGAYAPVTRDPHPSGAVDPPAGAAVAAVLASVREETPRPGDTPVPAAGTPFPGVDLERLLDLRRADKVRKVFGPIAQAIELWEILCLVADEGPSFRQEVERLLRLKEKGGAGLLQEGALALFRKLAKVRTERGPLVRKLEAYITELDLGPFDAETHEIALAFIVSAARSRERAARWVEGGDANRAQAFTYMEHALRIAQGYQSLLRGR